MLADVAVVVRRRIEERWCSLFLQLANAIQFRFVERDRAVIVQATKFLLPFLVVVFLSRLL
jgi:hypothetical protein